ncbi:KR domain-containing protein [Roseibium salinum]|nr:KR domain-containing protein [Roseibium salinum]
MDRLAAIGGTEAAADDVLCEVSYDPEGLRRAWLPVCETELGEAQTLTIDPEGVYWITGGLGGLGRIFADWLILKGALQTRPDRT